MLLRRCVGAGEVRGWRWSWLDETGLGCATVDLAAGGALGSVGEQQASVGIAHSSRGYSS